MELEQAIKLIEQALANINTNLQGHQQLQMALKVVKEKLKNEKA